jgi:hypothetical protein
MPKIWAECPRGDWLMWWLQKTKQIDKTKAVAIAVACAERALPKFEASNKSDAPRRALEAAKAWLDNPCDQTRAAAADAYPYAADAAYEASYTDADAFYAASYAAYAAAYDDADASYAANAYAANAAYANAFYAVAPYAAAAERKWQAEKIREIVGACPFEN